MYTLFREIGEPLVIPWDLSNSRFMNVLEANRTQSHAMSCRRFYVKLSPEPASQAYSKKYRGRHSSIPTCGVPHIPLPRDIDGRRSGKVHCLAVATNEQANVI